MRRLAALSMLVVLAGCPGRPTTIDGECVTSNDCPPSAPFCEDQTCVACLGDSDCDCFEVCDGHACVPLGADLASAVGGPEHAHGTWDGAPGTPTYTFIGTCTEHAECPRLGQLCNPFTQGCVDAADFDDACVDSSDCTPGFACAVDLQDPVCLPTPYCRTAENCCGQPELVCDAAPGDFGLCVARQDDCTPPTEIDSGCPFLPKERGGDCDGAPCCDANAFCAAFGACVECVCDLDCNPGGNNGLKCYRAEYRCRPESYCVLDQDCAVEERCDLPNTTCRPMCTPETEPLVCAQGEFCSTDLGVCRPVTSRPCTADAFEPNASVLDATALPLPSLDGTNTVRDLSICTADEDWYIMDLEAGDVLEVQGRPEALLEADVHAFAPDRLTRVGSLGFFSPFSTSLLELTAHVSGPYYLQTTPTGAETGFYSLTLRREAGPACGEAFELTHGFNDTPTDATFLFDGAAPSALEGCELSSGQGGVEILQCDALILCEGDVDYYAIAAPNGADVHARLSGFSGDLDLSLYGPFAELADVDTTPVLAEAVGNHLIEVIDTTARPASFFLLRVYAASGGETPYALEIETNPATALCPEDVYDDPGGPGSGTPLPPTLVTDPTGYNDLATGATAVALVANDTVALDATPLTLCRADADWFELGEDVGGAVVALPAGQRVQLAVEIASDSPASGITLAAGTDPSALAFGSVDTEAPITALTIPITTGERLWVRVAGSPANAAHVAYTLRATWVAPPACELDTLSDVDADGPGGADPVRNDTPASAVLLDPADGWPSVQPEAYAYPDQPGAQLSLCAADLDWYALTVPDGAQVLAHVRHDPRAAEVTLALYDSSVPPAGGGATLPTTGRLALSSKDDSGYQQVRATATGTVYLAVQNRTGWPLTDYELGVRFLSTVCFDDAHEVPLDNDTYDRATPFFERALAPLAGAVLSPGEEWGVLDPLAICTASGGEQDFYGLDLHPGDRIDAWVYYRPSEGELTLRLHAPGPAGLNEVLATDTAQLSGVLQVGHTVGASEPLGAYLLRVLPSAAPRNLYYLETRVLRGCADDAREPYPPHELAVVDGWSPGVGPIEQAICFDEDWAAITVPPGVGDVTLCTAYDGDAIDLLLEVYSGVDLSNPSVPVGVDLQALSDERADSQRITLARPTAEQQTYVVRTYPTYTPRPDPFAPPHPFQANYLFWVLEGDTTCPPTVCSSAADCQNHGACDPAGHQGFGQCVCDPGFAGAQCDACAAGHFGDACDPCPLCMTGQVCEDGRTGRGCVALAGEACVSDEDCQSGTCRLDWAGAEARCLSDMDLCLLLDGAAVLERPLGYVECADTSGYKVCGADGVWLAGATCVDQTCAPDGEAPDCGRALNACVSGVTLGGNAGCDIEDLGGGTCVDCGPYTAAAGTCNDAPGALVNCSIACGSPCEGTAPVPTGVFYCDGDLRREAVELCSDLCTLVADPASDLIDRDCATECGGTCVLATTDCDC